MLVGVVGGSVLTVAYTLRFLIGTFGGRADEALSVQPLRPAITAVTVPLGVLSVAGFVALGVVTGLVRDAAVTVNPSSAVYELLRWPGLTTGFVLSMLVLVVGGVLGWVLAPRVAAVPRPLGAEAADRLVDLTLQGARALAVRVQHGSLPVYLVTMVLVTALAAAPFVVDVEPDALVAWDHALQPAIAALVVVAAVGAARVPSRLGAALGLGAVGFGVAALFGLQGAPDLALTQLLVETVIVVGFVIGLGRLARDFPPVGQTWRNVRIVASVLVGAGVAVGLAAAASRPVAEPPLEDLVDQAVEPGGGNNVVNVVLTDMRALDTLGEIIVLAVVAIGVVALARAGRAGGEHSSTLPGEGAADLAPRRPGRRPGSEDDTGPMNGDSMDAGPRDTGSMDGDSMDGDSMDTGPRAVTT
jgi:multicomponent Na+:H+ antiporter subunit A